MTPLYQDLTWLPRAPADFRDRCKAVAAVPDVAALRHLAGHALDINQLTWLAKLIDASRASGAEIASLAAFRLGVVSNATTSLIVPALTATALRYGVSLEVIDTPFDQALQESLDPNSSLHRGRPDAVLVALDHRGLRLRPTPGDAVAAARTIEDAIEHVRAIRHALRAAGILAILQTVPQLPETLFGGLDRQIPGTLRDVVDGFNRRLAGEIRGSSDLLLDAASLAEIVGLAAWHDATQWALAKLPFAQQMVPLYADHVCRLLGAMRGKSRRCLVLDLDNTLWSGVIGDDGLEGIVVGEGSAVGEAHLAVQRYALELRQRGIVLAVASKNDDAVARRPFAEHPDMLLRLEHIAVFQANWTDKAANLIAIADTLSLGRDALVFLDDNPAERELIRQKLPEVAVPELPDDAALYARTLSAAGYFEAVTFSADDRQRADFYQENARRLELQAGSGSLDDYLRSLGMTATFAPFDAVSRARIAQLINKSNQFNLTTRRLTEPEVEALESDPTVFTLQVRLADRFGDNGMIGVVTCRKTATAWDIDLWLMSCRVLKRRVEEAVLHEIARNARAAGASELRGRYIPTPRNGMVAEHYAQLGFRRIARHPDGSTEWSMVLADLAPVDLPLTIIAPALTAAGESLVAGPGSAGRSLVAA